MRGRLWGLFLLCQVDRPMGASAAEQRMSALQHVRCGSLVGPWENRGVRLHLFSVSVPWWIKGEGISSLPARLGLTHLRTAFLPPSVQALFTYPVNMACRIVWPGVFTTVGEVGSWRGSTGWQSGSWKDNLHCWELRRELYRRPHLRARLEESNSLFENAVSIS